MTKRRVRSSDGRSRSRRNRDEEMGIVETESGIGDSIEEVMLDPKTTKSVLTKTKLFYDFQIMRRPKDKNGRTQSSLWIHLFCWFGLVLYTGLFVMEGLEIVAVGWDTPIYYGIFHGVLLFYFGLIFVVTSGDFMQETLQSDNLRPAVVTGHASLMNGISAILFLIWLVKNRSQYSDIDYDKNPKATVNYDDVTTVSFVLYVVWITVVILTYVIHYNFGKFIEILTMVVQHLDKNYTSDYLKTLLRQAEKHSKTSRSKISSDIAMISRIKEEKKSLPRKRRTKSRDSKRSNKEWLTT